MQSDPQDRRQSGDISEKIDEAVDLAHECGWRYALAYLISERVSPDIIQRLMFGGGQSRRKPPAGQSAPSGIRLSSAWNDNDEMRDLFVSLRHRRNGGHQ